MFSLGMRSVIPQVAAAFPSEAQRLVELALSEVERYAVANAPVRTGKLRSSQSHSVRRTSSGAEGEATSHAGYDLFVNFGTNDTAAHPYYSRAASQGRQVWWNGWNSIERRLPSL